MLSELELFYERQEEPLKSCMLALRSIIIDFDPALKEMFKYRLPFFCYPKKNLCYLWKDKQTGNPYIGIMEGRQIEHPALVKGDRKRIKVLPIDPNIDIPVDTIIEILHLAKSYTLDS